MTNVGADGERDTRPLIAHVVYRLDVGGLENGLVNLINRLPANAYRHAIVSLTEVTDFSKRISRDDVRLFACNKGAGHLYRLYPRLFRLFRALAPQIVHTRNLAALEATVPAWMAGVRIRIHGEHGRDVDDLDGTNLRYQRIRRLYKPFVSRYIAVSKNLEQYLCSAIGVGTDRVVQIYNGVDTARFSPAAGVRPSIDGCPFDEAEHWLVGTVGRMQAVKDQCTLAKAFARAVHRDQDAARRMRLVVIGDGPLRPEVERTLEAEGVRSLAWLAGTRSDVSDIIRGLDCFVLPSLAEGISNTVLEAMSSGLSVVATRVGGNVELIDSGNTGTLVPAADEESMTNAILAYFRDAPTARRHGYAARQAALARFSLDRMIDDYRTLYDDLLAGRNDGLARAGVAR
jgi:sugar transferase (PEP-CTERM/EpsH1 system associated)